MRIYVFRTDTNKRDWLWSEINKGQLRQGWGCRGSSLTENGNLRSKDDWITSFQVGAQEAWNQEFDESSAESRHRILLPMVEINKGDLIIVPKMPNNQTFVLCQAAGSYSFDDQFPDTSRPDHGHVIPIEGAIEVGYKHNILAREISSAFTGYQRAVNRVQSPNIRKAAISLLNQRPDVQQMEPQDLLEEVRGKALARYHELLAKLSPSDLEKAIAKLFESAGYAIVRTNFYDREGGDADIVLAKTVPLLGEVATMESTLYVQVKHKVGVAQNDIAGIEQLVKITREVPHCIKILVSTADDFTDECKVKAEEEDVILISGVELSEAFLRFQ